MLLGLHEVMHVERVLLKAKYLYNYKLLKHLERKNLGENTRGIEGCHLQKALDKFFEAEQNRMWKQDHLFEVENSLTKQM